MHNDATVPLRWQPLSPQTRPSMQRKSLQQHQQVQQQVNAAPSGRLKASQKANPKMTARHTVRFRLPPRLPPPRALIPVLSASLRSLKASYVTSSATTGRLGT